MMLLRLKNILWVIQRKESFLLKETLKEDSM